MLPTAYPEVQQRRPFRSWVARRVAGALVSGLSIWLAVSVLHFPYADQAMACRELDAFPPEFLVFPSEGGRAVGPWFVQPAFAWQQQVNAVTARCLGW